MSQDLDEIVLAFGRDIARDATNIIHDDILEIMDNDEQFVGGEPTEAEPPVALGAARELTEGTVQFKAEQGFPYPEKPRYRTGQMFHSLEEDLDDLTGIVGIGDLDSEKVEYQQKTRPFMGVSTRAYEKINDRLLLIGKLLVEELNKQVLEPVTSNQ